MKLFRFVPIGVAAVLISAGCGGGNSSPQPAPAPTPAPIPAPTGGGGGGPVNAPTIITVAAGQQITGVNIAVVAPAASPALNVEDLGVVSGASGGSAANTGDQIHRGTVMRVLIFGNGLDSSTKVSIGGPNDILVSGVAGIKSTTGKAGIEFTATVAGNAALGARSVIVQNSKNDIAVFTGGLEVVP